MCKSEVDAIKQAALADAEAYDDEKGEWRRKHEALEAENTRLVTEAADAAGAAARTIADLEAAAEEQRQLLHAVRDQRDETQRLLAASMDRERASAAGLADSQAARMAVEEALRACQVRGDAVVTLDKLCLRLRPPYPYTTCVPPAGARRRRGRTQPQTHRRRGGAGTWLPRHP